MEHYEVLSVAGEGSYGIVMKCRMKNTEQIVAIKKLLNFENDAYVKRMAYREIRILKKLQHSNLVRLLEVFKRKNRFYLVFEYLDRTVLNDLEENPTGLSEKRCKEYIYQLLCAVEFCHNKNIIHRDIKPENLLISKNGVLKLCDFGYARLINKSTASGNFTEYVATRWYRAPELLIRENKYGKPIDIWAVGCVYAEILSGEPLFPGNTDVDQLHLIHKTLGKSPAHHGVRNFQTLMDMFPVWPITVSRIVAGCLELDPNSRHTAKQILAHEYFKDNSFTQSMALKLRQCVKQKHSPILPEPLESLSNFSTPRIDLSNVSSQQPAVSNSSTCTVHVPPINYKGSNNTNENIHRQREINCILRKELNVQTPTLFSPTPRKKYDDKSSEKCFQLRSSLSQQPYQCCAEILKIPINKINHPRKKENLLPLKKIHSEMTQESTTNANLDHNVNFPYLISGHLISPKLDTLKK